MPKQDIIDNNYIDKYIKDYLLKENYDTEDLNNILEIVIDGNECYDYIEDLKKLKNIEDVEIRNCQIKDNEINELKKLNNLYRLSFNECTFENISILNNMQVKSLSIINCKIDNYDFIYKLYFIKHLTIVKGIVDFEKINFLTNIEYLRISESNIINVNEIRLRKIKQLFIDGTNIVNLDFIKNIDKLELLSISRNQIEENKELIEEIKDKITIVYDSILPDEVSIE